jgi:hypothetical protein
MNNKLPNYVLRKKFKHCFLFSESEVSYKDVFNQNIQKFSNALLGKEIIVEIMNFKLIDEYSSFSIIKIPNSDSSSLSRLGEISLIDDQSVEDLLGDYYIFDDTREWEFYVSLIDETVVFGCNSKVLDVFLNIFEPYKEVSFKEKLKEIYGCCNIEIERNIFITELCKNYNWQFQF